jgi:hypothetical protein
MRTAISLAALLVKVTSRSRPGAMPASAMRCATAAVSVQVLPVPAPARARTAAYCAARWRPHVGQTGKRGDRVHVNVLLRQCPSAGRA